MCKLCDNWKSENPTDWFENIFTWAVETDIETDRRARTLAKKMWDQNLKGQNSAEVAAIVVMYMLTALRKQAILRMQQIKPHDDYGMIQ